MKVLASKTKSILLVLILALTTGLFILFNPVERTAAVSNMAGRIAYVDLWVIFNYHPEKVEAEEELNQLAQAMQAELEEKAKGLAKNEQQELLEQYQTRLTQRERELVQNIIDKIRKEIAELAGQKELKMVLDKNNVIYGGIDLTEEVINYIEEKYKENDPGQESANREENPGGEAAASLDDLAVQENNEGSAGFGAETENGESLYKVYSEQLNDIIEQLKGTEVEEKEYAPEDVDRELEKLQGFLGIIEKSRQTKRPPEGVKK